MCSCTPVDHHRAVAVIAPLTVRHWAAVRRVALALPSDFDRVGGAIRTADGATGSFPRVLYPCALAMMVFSKSFKEAQ